MQRELRKSTLELAEAELQALFEGASALAQRELGAVRDGPIFAEPPTADRLSRIFDGHRDLPLEGESMSDLLQACAQVLDAGRRTGPCFFGYVHSPASPIGVAADLLASAADQNVTAWRSAPAATEVERLAVRWLGALVGYSDDPAGLFVGGGSAANLTALLVALRNRAAPDVDRRRLCVYTSDETHFSTVKAASVIGVTARSVPVDDRWRLNVDALRDAIAQDRRAGLAPFCVVASAGTTSTGAVDPLEDIASLAAQEELWFHVDGAYGALAASDPASRARFAGMERADSLSIDAHKWLYVPVDCGALLLRDPMATARAFGDAAGDYVRVFADEASESFAFWDHGLELSRRFRALKVWMTLRYYGARHIAATIAEDVTMAAHLADLIRDSDDFELLAGPSLSICCFRHVPAGMPDAAVDRHNAQLLEALQRDGRVYLSNATLHGRFALRACITNFRTTRADIARTLEVIRELGARADER